MTTHPPLRKESANGFIPSCLSPRFPWPLVLLTRAPQALPTAADRRILICASTPGSYSPGFWGRGVGTPRPVPAQPGRVPGPGTRRWTGGLADGLPSGPAARRDSLCGAVAWPRGSATSPRFALGMRGTNVTLCVYPHCSSSFSLPGRFSDSPTLPSLPGSSLSVAPCVWQKSLEGPPLLTPSRRSLNGLGTSPSSDK